MLALNVTNSGDLFKKKNKVNELPEEWQLFCKSLIIHFSSLKSAQPMRRKGQFGTRNTKRQPRK